MTRASPPARARSLPQPSSRTPVSDHSDGADHRVWVPGGPCRTAESRDAVCLVLPESRSHVAVLIEADRVVVQLTVGGGSVVDTADAVVQVISPLAVDGDAR